VRLVGEFRRGELHNGGREARGIKEEEKGEDLEGGKF
jgi:hypothetical protein